MNSELQLSLLLRQQVEDIYGKNHHASLLPWREFREEVRRRVKPHEIPIPQDADEFTISPYKKSLSKYRDNLSQQKYLMSLKSGVHSPKQTIERSVSASSLKKPGNQNSLEKVFPLKTLIKLESVVSRSSLNKSNKEYLVQLESLAHTILNKLKH